MVTARTLAEAIANPSSVPGFISGIGRTIPSSEVGDRKVITIARRRLGGGGGGGSTIRSQIQAPPSFESSLLRQSFGSAEAKKKAEDAFRAKQALERAVAQRAAERRQTSIEGRRISGQISGGFGGISISAADDSLKSFIERREPITGTLAFLAEKTRGFVGKKEEKFTPQSQSLAQGITGERVSSAAQILPFVIPATAPLAFISTGISRFVTPGGRAEAEDIGLGLEERFGIPAKIGEVGAFGLSALGIVVGGVGGVKQLEKVLGLPKFGVKFLAEQQPFIQNIVRVGEDVFISTKGVAEVTRKGLFGERTAITAFESIGKVKPGEDFFTFLTATRGASRPFKGLRFPTGTKVFGKPQPFGALTKGIGKEGEQLITLDIPAIGGTATKGVEGFKFISSTKLFTQRGKDFDKFISFGKGLDLPSGLFTGSRSAQIQKIFKLSGEELSILSKTGRADIFGLTKRAPVSEIDSGVGTLIVKSGRVDVAKSLTQQTIKDVIGRTFPRSVADIFAKPTTTTLSTLKSIQGQFPSTVQIGGRAKGSFTGTGQFEKTDFSGLIAPTKDIKITQLGLSSPTFKDVKVSQLGLSLPTFKDIQSSGLGLGLSSGLKQPQRELQLSRSLTILAQPSAQKPRTRTLQRTGQRTKQLQRQKQTFRSPSFSDFFGAPTPFFGGFGGFGLPFPKRSKKTKKKKVKVKRGIRSTLAPSFTASALGLTGRFPTPRRAGLGLTPEQFRLIPVRRRSRKKR